MGDTRHRLRSFPQPVRAVVGYGLLLAQQGRKHPRAKSLQGFGSAGVLELLADHDGDTYRAVYTVRFADAIYVLHAFQKKSKPGIATPKRDIDLIRARLADAQKRSQS